MQTRIIDTPLCRIWLEAEDGCLTGLRFSGCEESNSGDSQAVLDAAQHQIEEYFEGRRRAFDLPIRLKGTAFQQAVWRALMEIPYGETATYGEIARRIGREKACRAVGMANHVNPISLIVPCHRVIGADGTLTGYGGGLAIKKGLLALERRWKETHVEV